MNNFKDIFGVENRTKYFTHVLASLCFISIVVFLLLIIGNNSLNKNEVEAATEKPDPFESLALEAKSAMVRDVVNERELFAKNPDVPLPLASLTKVMTAVTAYAFLSDSANVKILLEYLEPEGDSGLVVDDIWRASDLRDFTLLTSSNDGAFALAAVAESQTAEKGGDPQAQFLKAMNNKAAEIGLSNSRFFNEHGLDREMDRGGAYGSARDMALLFEYTLKNYPEILEATRYKSLQFGSAEKVYAADNTNIFINEIPGILASKTGFTDLAGGNLVIAFDSGLNRPIIISILGSTEEGRFADTLKLVNASLKYIQEN